ncbi:MAG: hypothetical protein ACYDH5_16560 [Acidimicrobiales bacterium]
MPERGRALVAWDWEADGIWLVAARDGGQPVSWHDLVSIELSNDLREWNDSADELYGPGGGTSSAEREASFWQHGRELAFRAQAELGPGWEVLYQEASGAWTWVDVPVR